MVCSLLAVLDTWDVRRGVFAIAAHCEWAAVFFVARDLRRGTEPASAVGCTWDFFLLDVFVCGAGRVVDETVGTVPAISPPRPLRVINRTTTTRRGHIVKISSLALRSHITFAVRSLPTTAVCMAMNAEVNGDENWVAADLNMCGTCVETGTA